MAIELSGKNGVIEWSVKVRRTPNGNFNALVKVGTWTAISEDHLTEDQAKHDGCEMMASMLQEVEELING